MTIMRRRGGKEEEGRKGDRRGRRTREEEASATATEEWKEENCSHAEITPSVPCLCSRRRFLRRNINCSLLPKEVAGKEQGNPTA